MSSITNLINGITIECHDEGLDDRKNPAKVTIHDKRGKLITTIFAEKGQIQGADGGMYTAIKFNLRGKDPISEYCYCGERGFHECDPKMCIDPNCWIGTTTVGWPHLKVACTKIVMEKEPETGVNT